VLPHSTLGSGDALLIPKTKDGRVVFAIPFEGELLLGTTDDDYSDLGKEPILEAAEVSFLLETLQPFLKEKIEKEQVKSGFGGLRPLLFSSNNQTKTLVRDHEVEHDPASNLFSLLGGKWTTYRLMAKDAVDEVRTLLGISAECRTETHRLAGAEGWDINFWKKIQSEYGFEKDISQHLAQKYGTRARKLADLAKQQPELAERLLPNFSFIKAEVVYAVQEEMAYTVRDFLARRIRLEIMDWQAAAKAAPEIARLMGAKLGWPESEQNRQAKEYEKLLDFFQLAARS
jgi:glycerol-3-phosphate dehydrogenase